MRNFLALTSGKKTGPKIRTQWLQVKEFVTNSRIFEMGRLAKYRILGEKVLKS